MRLSQLTSNEYPSYQYFNSDFSCAHNYLLPTLFRELAAFAQGRSLKIVDLGCGNGYVAAQLAALGHTVTGVDVSTDGIAIARAAYPHAVYHPGSVYDDDLILKIPGPVDCVVSLEVVEHLFLPKKLFEQSHRLLADGGVLMVSTPYHGYVKNLALSLTNGWDRHFSVGWDGGHIKFFSKVSLAKMASEAGFRNIRILQVGRIPGFAKSMIMIANK